MVSASEGFNNVSARTELIVRNISAVTQKKLLKLKDEQGFGDKDWGEWLTHMAADIRLQDSKGEMIQKGTKDGLLKIWVQNLGLNLSKIWMGESINALVPQEAIELEKQGKDPDVPVPGKSAIIIGRGPSLYKNKHLEALAKSDYKGSVICSDGALIDALKAGVQPDKYEFFGVMSVDGNREKIWKWYDHELVDKYGPHIHAMICSTCAPNVIERLEKAKAHYYFFHPLFDDHRLPESVTKLQQFLTMCDKHPNGTPAMSAGGNAGSCAWIFSWVVLRRNPVALIGIDMGYRAEDDLSKTYYWKGIMEATGGDTVKTEAQYIKIFNPDTGLTAVMDAVFEHYRAGWLDMLKTAPRWVDLRNATEGGSLFGEGVTTQRFAEFLAENRT